MVIKKPSPAATLILVRDGAQGPEVLLLRRDNAAVFAAGVHVFPGGRVDSKDQAFPAAFRVEPDDATASKNLDITSGGLAYWIAAIRECFEEAGILLATGRQVDKVATRIRLREALMSGETTLHALCEEYRLRLATGKLHYVSRWITPVGQPRRFDTRFFIAAAPPGQTARACDRETFDPRWIRPEDALEAHRHDRLNIIYPTIKTLESLCGFTNAASMLASV